MTANINSQPVLFSTWRAYVNMFVRVGVINLLLESIAEKLRKSAKWDDFFSCFLVK
jgi:hypothetical protein